MYWGTRLACAEMIRTGTVAFMDMYWHPDAVAAAVRDSGIRATVGGPLVDMGDPERGAAVRSAAAETLEELTGSHPRVGVSLTPHSIYAVSEETLRWAGETSAEQRDSGSDPSVGDGQGGGGLHRRARLPPCPLPGPDRSAPERTGRSRMACTLMTRSWR